MSYDIHIYTLCASYLLQLNNLLLHLILVQCSFRFLVLYARRSQIKLLYSLLYLPRNLYQGLLHTFLLYYGS